jgi:hypothetical protein
VVVPLGFQLPEEIMADSKSVDDEFLCGVVCFEIDEGRNCNAYIKNEKGLRIFYKDDNETQLEGETVKNDIKMEFGPGMWVAYKWKD